MDVCPWFKPIHRDLSIKMREKNKIKPGLMSVEQCLPSIQGLGDLKQYHLQNKSNSKTQFIV